MSAARWIADRLPTDVTHLDIAAAGRVSRQVLAAEVAHLEAEVSGAYVAEQLAEPQVAAGRAALAALVGLTGDAVAFGEGAGSCFAGLLDVWPLPPRARIGTVAGEYGGNARVLQARAAWRGWTLVPLPVDDLGRITAVPAGLDLVTFPQVASQRGVVQPVADVLAAGVPVLLDVAQSLGQTAVPHGAAAYVGTSRKWLCGPRGVGFVMVDPEWEPRLADPPTLVPTLHSGARRLDSPEANIAGRVGLAMAARSWSPELPPVLQAAAAAARVLLGGGSWRVVEPVEEPSGITTLVPPDGVDVAGVRAALLAEGFLTGAVPATRAADMTGPVLRVATAPWVTPDDLDRLASALFRRTA